MSKIVKTTGICGGSARIDDTRIPVWLLVDMKNSYKDMTNEQFIEEYPHLNIEQLDAAWKYYEENKKEIDNDIKNNSFDMFEYDED